MKKEVDTRINEIEKIIKEYDEIKDHIKKKTNDLIKESLFKELSLISIGMEVINEILDNPIKYIIKH